MVRTPLPILNGLPALMPTVPQSDPRLRDLQIEYARILAEYRDLASEPFSFIGFGRMQKLVTRLEEIARALDKSTINSSPFEWNCPLQLAPRLARRL